jgi:hypothetical protein
MLKNFLVLAFISVFQILLFSQFSDDFSDGNFTNNPTWFGDDANFSVQNNELRLTAPAAADQSYLVTESGAIENATWEFYTRMTFQPSGSNLARIYLVSDASNLTGSLNGYFVMLGGTPREVSLFRQDGTNTTKIIDGVDNRLNSSQVIVRVKVTRDAIGNWELFSDTLGGTDYFQEGISFDNTHQQGFFFGVRCTYTATRSDRFYFDDFVVTGDPFFDPNPAAISSVSAIANDEVEVTFDKAITVASAENIANYSISGGIGTPLSATRDPNNSAKVSLTLANPLDIGVFYTLVANNITDLSGNVSGVLTSNLIFIEAQQPAFGDIVINEFMPRESPSQGLPERQFVELYNRSNKFFHLNGWKLSDRTGTGTIQDAWLYPDSFLILVPTSGLSDFSGPIINVTNWPSLNNTGDDIELATADGLVVDKISYTSDWYNNPDKSSGGFSIERINPLLKCSGAENWRASEDTLGGTPGFVNSVLDLTPDLTPAVLLETLAINEDEVWLRFDKGLDTNSLLNMSVTTNPVLPYNGLSFEGAFPAEFTLHFDNAIDEGVLYTLQLDGVEDCSNNPSNHTAKFVLPQFAEKGDLIINEILHNVLVGGSDFIEIYNNSDKYIDLIDWELANFSGGEMSNKRAVDYNYVVHPRDYVVITRDSSFQLANYPAAVSGKFIQIPSLPAYNNDSSTVFLLFDDEVMDKVSYTSDWHFRLLRSQRGVSLERFDPLGPSNDGANWHSASESIGFATPGAENSQRINIISEGTLTLSSNSFSPDNDGFEDVLIMTYELSDPEMVGDLIIYDDLGRKVRTLLNNHLFGAKGVIQWDGIRDNGTKASIGPHVILLDVLNLQTGEKITIRKVVTVAGML